MLEHDSYRRHVHPSAGKCRFFKPINLRNDRREACSYYGRLIGSHAWVFDWYQFRWPWMTLKDFLQMHYHTLYSFFRSSLCRSEWRQTHTISGKNIAPGQIVQFSDVQIMHKNSQDDWLLTKILRPQYSSTSSISKTVRDRDIQDGQIKRGQLTFLLVTSECSYKIKWFLGGINYIKQQVTWW